MPKIGKGIAEAAYRLVLVGLILPFVLDYLAPLVSRYITLPPSEARWTVFIAFGIFFAFTGFFEGAYSNGEYPWLFGRIAGGIVSLAFYTYLFLLFLPSAAGLQIFHGTGLLFLFYVAIGLSYLYLVLDFFDARRHRTTMKAAEGEVRVPRT